MCGICGIVDFGQPVAAELIRKMTDTLTHRGPDGSGVHTGANVGLGHRRLSIIDLSAAGAQPMTAVDGQVVLSYNGEIYNFVALRSELERMGVRFVGHSDTEVLLQAYIAWGEETFGRLNGMFAFAIWDGRSQDLLLVRDRFGVKPLYYYADERDRLVFGSEIKALLASGSVPSQLDPAALHEFLYYANPLGQHTLFKGVRTLKPGSVLRMNRSGITTHAYWEPDPTPSGVTDETEAVGEIRRRLEQAIQGQLVSDVPVGVFLSGGIDSSSIASFASAHYGGELQTFSVGFDFDEGINELPKARSLAAALGTDHHELIVAGYELEQVLTALVRAHDHPFGDAANIPLYLLCAQLDGSPKVILQGDGGDEMFAGYRRYNLLDYDRLAHPAARLVWPLVKGLRGGETVRRSKRMVEAFSKPDLALRLASLLTIETPSSSPTRILASSYRREVEASDAFAEYRLQTARFASLDPVQRMLYVDSQIQLPNLYLEKVDRSTMAHSIEVRVPFLDYGVTDYAMTLPSNMKVHRGQKKYLLRQALRGVVPDAILDGPKHGLSVPFSSWLRGPLSGYAKEVLLSEDTRRFGIFDPVELESCLDAHISGHQQLGSLLWNALNLALWLQIYEPSI